MLLFYDKVLNKVACLGIDMSNMDLVRIVQVFHYRLRNEISIFFLLSKEDGLIQFKISSSKIKMSISFESYVDC